MEQVVEEVASDGLDEMASQTTLGWGWAVVRGRTSPAEQSVTAEPPLIVTSDPSTMKSPPPP